MKLNEAIQLHALAEQVTAEAGSRTISGVITVFNVTSPSHRLRLLPGCLTPRQPLKRVKMLRDHNHSQPVGYMTEFNEDTAGEKATATFYIPEGEAGDQALSEAESGLRDGLSVGFVILAAEFDEDAGEIVVSEAELYETSVCAIPAFQDAQVEHVAASVAAQIKKAGETMPESTNGTTASGAPVPTGTAPHQATEPAAPAAGTASLQVREPEPVQLAGPAYMPGPAALAGDGAGRMPGDARREFRAAIDDGGDIALALDPIIQSDVFDAQSVPAYVGELWRGRGYVQRYAPLMQQETLTAQKMIGWRWVTGPDVDDYAGNLAEVPTNIVEAEEVPFSAGRIASGHKVDRIHVDLPSGGFWDSFYKERATNYAKKEDAKALSHIRTAGNFTAKTVPAGDTDPWSKLFTGAQWCLEVGIPNYAIVGADYYKQMAMTADSDKLAFLNAQLGLEEGSLANFKIVGAPISNTSMDGSVTVGCTGATEHYRLPGGPIRVEALDVAAGGVDAGLFGYQALFTTDARGVVSVTEAAV